MKLIDRFRTAPLSIAWGTCLGAAFGVLAAIAVAIVPGVKLFFLGAWLLLACMTFRPAKRPDRIEEMWADGTRRIFDGLVMGLCFLVTTAVAYVIVCLTSPR